MDGRTLSITLNPDTMLHRLFTFGDEYPVYGNPAPFGSDERPTPLFVEFPSDYVQCKKGAWICHGETWRNHKTRRENSRSLQFLLGDPVDGAEPGYQRWTIDEVRKYR